MNGNSPSTVDRLGQPISAENAQALLPPSACVFVAKYMPPPALVSLVSSSLLTPTSLSSSRTDEELQQSVDQVFREFGKVYVKIRRDGRGMPYAFCQYEVGTFCALAMN